jgi:hypothetical protein
MEIKFVQEYEDGSADFLITGMSTKEQEFFINKGVVAAISEMVDREIKEGKLPALLKEKLSGSE